MSRRGLLYVISGPSGVGKGTICKKLVEAYADVRVSISCTTRAMRPGEAEGREYFYVSNERFDEMIEKDELLEYACVHGNRYGTPRTYVEKMLNEGYDMILEIDVQGGAQVMKTAKDMTGIFVLPPSYDILIARLMGRKTESEEQIRLRLKNAQEELHRAREYEYLLINDDLECAVEKLRAIIEAKHMRYEEKKPFLDKLLSNYEEEQTL